MKQLLFTILYQPLYNVLIFLAWLIPGHSIGIAIIILTIIIRLILLPSSLKAARLQIKNAELQPKINKLRAEIKDQAEQSKALMQLYKDEGVSPFGSCLPLLLQIPILIALYSVFKSGLSTASFGHLYSFMPRPEYINTVIFGVDLSKPDLWVLPILAGLSQGLLSWMTLPKTQPTGNDPMANVSKQMIFLLPIMTVFFGRTMPAALVVYWIVQTLFGIGQQWYVNSQVKSEKSKVKSAEVAVPEKPKAVEDPVEKPAKKDFIANIMNKRLDKQEKKADVTVTVRTKKRT